MIQRIEENELQGACQIHFILNPNGEIKPGYAGNLWDIFKSLEVNSKEETPIQMQNS